MSEYTAIADVGRTLLWLLRNNINRNEIPTNRIPPESIGLLSPADVENQQNIHLTLFLYNIGENPYLKNQEMQDLSPTELQYPPISLDLYYLLTAYAPQIGRMERTIREHEILGRAMRIFYDNGIVSGSVRQGDLAKTDEELRIILNPISLEDLNKLWSIFPNQSYRTSVSYLVTPVRIDSIRGMDDVKRVVSKKMDHRYMVPKGEGE